MRAAAERDNLDLFADLLEPAAEILGDKELAEILKSGGKPVRAIRLAIKNHKGAVLEMLAALDGVPAAEYKAPGPIALTAKLLGWLNNPELQNLFTMQGQKRDAAASGSATESTGDGVK